MQQPGENAPKPRAASPTQTIHWDEERVRQLERALAVIATVLAENGMGTDDESVQAVVTRAVSQ